MSKHLRTRLPCERRPRPLPLYKEKNLIFLCLLLSFVFITPTLSLSLSLSILPPSPTYHYFNSTQDQETKRNFGSSTLFIFWAWQAATRCAACQNVHLFISNWCDSWANAYLLCLPLPNILAKTAPANFFSGLEFAYADIEKKKREIMHLKESWPKRALYFFVFFRIAANQSALEDCATTSFSFGSQKVPPLLQKNISNELL